MEQLFKTITAVAGGAASYLWGGWSAILQALLLFVAVDYFTGIMAAGKQGKLSSQVGFWGIFSKVSIFLVVAVAHMVDQVLGDGHMFRDSAITFYLCNEGLSILENAGKLNAPIPDFLKRAIEALKGDKEKGVK